jgi:hypothetical protein
VLDVGGDDRGAVALGRYVPDIVSEGDYEMLFVTNFFRPLTRTAEDALGVPARGGDRCGIRATALVNNSNLGRDTTAADVLGTLERMRTLSALSGLPIAFTAADARLKDGLEKKLDAPFWMELQKGSGFEFYRILV